MRSYLLPSTVMALALPMGCEREPAAASSKPASQPAVAAPAASASPAAASTQKAPRGKPTTTSSDAEVGTLPDGVGIRVGEKVPEATLTTSDGKSRTLSELHTKGAILLVFYRGGWCPYCNFQVRELTTANPELQERGVTPVFVSVDRMEESARTTAAYDIPFPVLSDPDLVAHKAFRVMHQADSDEVARLRGFGHDLEASSGRDHHVIAIPSIFLVDREGLVRWAHADRDYKRRPSVGQLLNAIDEAGLKKTK